MATVPRNRFGSTGVWSRREVLLGGLTAAFTLARAAQAGEDVAAACALSPELTEGPYYLDRPKLRRDITEGRPGVPLILRIRLLDGACRPLGGAAVDVWHCDALGAYSGYGGQSLAPPPGGPAMPRPPGAFGEPPPGKRGERPPHPPITDRYRFLRGVQLTDAGGTAEFHTIVPGWYVGRAVHIHLKAHVGGKFAGHRYAGGHVCHTGQFGFAEDFYTSISALQPYARHQVARTRLEQDGILSPAGPVLKLAALGKEPAQGYLGTISFTADPEAVPDGR